jgi:hypothetical protein
MARIRIKRGSEGPQHDPYSFTEVTFYFTDKTKEPVKYHGGLAEWTQHGSVRYDIIYACGIDPALIFEELTGISVRRAEAIPDMLLERSMRKYSRQERENIMECIEADQAMLRYAM